MKVEELIIDGFKSYATRTVISGWDASFNCITGLNGSGKSNILDAICFVLGITTMSTVRAQNLQDLIYKRGQAGVTKASVTIVFDNSDAATSPMGFEDQLQISVTRQIVLGGTSKFLINGHRAQHQSVQQLFQSVQLNINNPNFLIMQGQITKVLNMKATEILALIEEAAGTRMFEDRREKAVKTMGKKEKKVEEILALLHEEIEPKLENLRSEKRAFLDYQRSLSSLERLQRIVVAFDYVEASRRLQSQKQQFDSAQSRHGELTAAIDKTNLEIETLEKDVETLRKRREDQVQKGGKFQLLERQYKDASQEVARLNTALEIKVASLTEDCAIRDALKKSLAAIESEVAKQSKSLAKIRTQYETAKERNEKSASELARQEELLQSLQTGVSSKAGQQSGYASQLQEVRTIINDAKTSAAQAEVRKEHLEKIVAEDSSKTAKARQQNEKVLKDLSTLESRYEQLKQQLETAGWEAGKLEKLRERERELSEEARGLRSTVESMRRTLNVDFNYSRPSPTFRSSSVQGIVAQLFTLEKKRHAQATALEVCAGGKLFNVVVDTDLTAAQLLQHGKLRKRSTFIPLNKITARRVANEQLLAAKKLAPGKVELALETIGYEAEVFSAMEYVFGNTLLCQDAATAQRVTFDPKVKTRSVTLEGDVYDPRGTLSGGSKAGSSGILLSIQKYNQATAALREKLAELETVRRQISHEMRLLAEFKEIKTEMDLKDHEISLLKEKLSKSPSAQILLRYEERVNEIASLVEQVAHHSKAHDEGVVELARIERDMSEFKQDKGSKLEQLKQTVEKLRAETAQHDEKMQQSLEVLQTAQAHADEVADELNTGKEELSEKQASIEELQSAVDSGHEQQRRLAEQEARSLQSLETERAAMLSMDDELATMEDVLTAKRKQVTEHNLEIQRLGHDVEKQHKSLETFQTVISRLEADYEWVAEAKEQFGRAGTVYDFSGINIDESRREASRLDERIKSMRKSVNSKVMNMIESVEKKEESLKTMITTIEKDKNKIEETIESLDAYKREAVIKTWEKVSVDFGKIFGDLLPGSTAKLVPQEGREVTEGLEVKVCLGKVWKDGLAELSGGQRSLIALSLILSLLQFKPAPMYILDEVDAALDLHHTQNIGHIIKTRFQGSQFIVVSLKEGMFTNANRVFRARFVDGTSTVAVIS